MADLPAREKFGQVEPAPAVNSNATELAEQEIGFVFAVRPEFRGLSGDRGID